MRNLITAILLFVTLAWLTYDRVAHADISLNVGLGKSVMSGQHGQPFERMVGLGYQHVLAPELYVRPEVTYFLDLSGHGKSSLIGAVLLGVKAQSSVGPQLHFAIGPAYLQNPDAILGGKFQFKLEFGAGIESEHIYLGAAWVHVSSAGIEIPNAGRDFFPTAQLVVHL